MGEKEEKKRRKLSPIGFRNFFRKLRKKGGELIKMGVQITIFEILNLGLLEYFRSRIASGGSNPAS